MMQPIFDLITAPPGGFLYHLALALCAAAALLISYKLTISSPVAAQRRRSRALWVILSGQLLLMLISILSWQQVLPARWVIPPLNQSILTLSLAWAAWAWYQQVPHLLLDTALAGLHILVAALLAATLMGWNPDSGGLSFVSTWFHGIWELFSLLIVLTGSRLILRKKPPGWISGLSFLAIQGFAIVADFLIHQPGQDFSIPLMLAQLAAFPLLLNLPRQADSSPLVSGASGSLSAQDTASPHPARRERRRFATDQKTFQAALNLAIETQPELLCTSLTRFTAHMMVSDLCFLIHPADPSGDVIIEGGYDLIQEETWPGASIQASRIPVIAGALSESQPVLLQDGDENSTDLHQLADVLGLDETGNLMFVPLIHEINGPLGGLILLSAYSQRIWSPADEAYLMAGASQLSRLLQKQKHLPYSEAGGKSHSEDAIPPESVSEFFATLLDDAEHPSTEFISSRESELQRALELLREENHRLLAALEAAKDTGESGSSSPNQEQNRELEQALHFANLRIEKLERGQSGRDPVAILTLPSLIEAALVQAGQITDDKHVTMRVDIPSNLPPIQADPAAMKEVLVLALRNALQETAVQGTIVLKAQAEASPEGTAYIHLKVISTATLFGDFSPVSAGQRNDDTDLQKARSLIAAQAGRIWLDPLAGGALVTNLVVPAYHDPVRNSGQAKDPAA